VLSTAHSFPIGVSLEISPLPLATDSYLVSSTDNKREVPVISLSRAAIELLSAGSATELFLSRCELFLPNYPLARLPTTIRRFEKFIMLSTRSNYPPARLPTTFRRFEKFIMLHLAGGGSTVLLTDGNVRDGLPRIY